VNPKKLELITRFPNLNTTTFLIAYMDLIYYYKKNSKRSLYNFQFNKMLFIQMDRRIFFKNVTFPI
jgi:hypothetical protein